MRKLFTEHSLRFELQIDVPDHKSKTLHLQSKFELKLINHQSVGTILYYYKHVGRGAKFLHSVALK